MSTQAPAPTRTIPAGLWKSDPVHSWIGFSARHMVVSTFRGQLPSFDVAVEDGVLAGSAPVRSIETRDPNLTAHLASPDFFDAERHPEVTFRSTSVDFEGDELVLAGELTMRGVAQPLTLRGSVVGPHPDPYGLERLGIHVTGSVDRRDFGIGWQAEIPGGGLALGYEVALEAELELVKQG